MAEKKRVMLYCKKQKFKKEERERERENTKTSRLVFFTKPMNAFLSAT